VELVATLLTDVPLDAASFRGVLMDLSRSSLAGAIVPDGLIAEHSYGDAEYDDSVRDVRVRVRPGNSAPRAAVVELAKVGFRPVTALSIETSGDRLSRDDAWILCSLYAAELQGWVLTSYLDYDTALAYQGGDDHGLLHVPIGGRRRSVLIAASTMRELAGAR
jgi:hypothetical protein